MAYISLYRKWRPETFSDIAGQQNIIRTLKNAIELDRVAHAYLFCGPRGTGKTSTAKILAKSLNCREGPTIDPCNQCPVCTKINDNSSVDVIEIDAASNRGIDEIRELREKVKFSPTEGNYKVYIIDEVHMLTTEAFNALLKTLEEPPDYVIFILATTEPHKLLPTVLSRCQRFDFGRLSLPDIKERLNYICQQEGIDYTASALTTIARNAEGGMRDAISILDQVISFSGGELDAQDVASVLGMVNQELLFELIEIMAVGEVEAGLELVNRIIDQGKDIPQFVTDLIYYLRNLLLSKECETIDKLVDLTQESQAKLETQAKKLTVSQILGWIELLEELDYNLKQTDQLRVTLETGMIKLIKETADQSLEAILDRVARLEDLVDSDDPGQNQDQRTTASISDTEGSISDSKDNKSVEENSVEEKSAKSSQEDSASVTPVIEDKETVKLEDIQQVWPKVLADLKSAKITLHSVLKHNTSLESLEDNRLLIRLENESSFYKETLEEGKSILVKTLNKFLGLNLQVNYNFSRSKPEVEGDKSATELLDHPLVEETVDIFSGQVVRIERDD